jgi:DNA-directed RNA polymerase subunit K/omega
MEEEQEEIFADSEDFDLDELDDEEEASVDFDSEEIEDYRDVEHKRVKFKNDVIGAINLNDKHHLVTYIVPDDQRITSEIMMLEEYTEAVGIRATQIENGTPVFTDVTGYTDPIKMAKKEILDGKSPLKLVREMKQKENERWVEVWKVNEMTLPITRREIMQPTAKEVQERLGTKASEEPKPKPDKKKAEPKKVKRAPSKSKKKK